MSKVEETKNGSGDGPPHQAIEALTDALKETKITPTETASAPALVQPPVQPAVQQVAQPEAEPKTQSDSQLGESEKKLREKKHIVVRGITGKVKWFNITRGFGFIERDDGESDVFLHQSGVIRPGRKNRFSLYLKGGEEVEFDVINGYKGQEAGAVSSPGGYELVTFNPRYRKNKDGPRKKKQDDREGSDKRRRKSSDSRRTQRGPRKNTETEKVDEAKETPTLVIEKTVE